MAGVKGRSGGRNKLSVQEHLIRGTYRRDRHGLALATAPAVDAFDEFQMALQGGVVPRPEPAPAAPDWMPKAKDTKGLGVQSMALLAAALTTHQFSEVEGRLLLDACRCLTRAEQLETALEAAGLVDADGTPSPLLVALSRERRGFVQAWSLLRLEHR